MAEAGRSEEEEENTMRDTREQVVRRQPNSSGGKNTEHVACLNVFTPDTGSVC